MRNWQLVLLKRVDLYSMVGLIHQAWQQATQKKKFCASLSPPLERSVVPMSSCHATHLKGLLGCDHVEVIPLPGQ